MCQGPAQPPLWRWRLPAGHGRDDGDDLALADRRVQAVEKADVLVGQKDVHEPAQLATLVEQALGEARVPRIEGVEHLADGGAVHGHLAGPTGERPQLGRDPHADAHRSSPRSKSAPRAWSKASSVGPITAVGPTESRSASTVFRPWPVTRATTRSSERTIPAAASLASVAMVPPPAVSAKIPSVRASSRMPSITSSSVTAAQDPPDWRIVLSAYHPSAGLPMERDLAMVFGFTGRMASGPSAKAGG